ncbi:isochorismatase family protein [Pseudonocardiaceae bacterium YIM PH 21723]|nr:isochorismatase family protein [Pseudonocardiaceae bacterium YIM PH 21723]
MPLTTLDPKTALIVIDLQTGIVGLPTVHPIDEVVDRSATLAKAFRAKGLPVVLVNVAATPPGRVEAAGFPPGTVLPQEALTLVPELDQQPGDLLITKRSRSAFARTGLAEQLRELGVTQVVVTGVATGAGVESTARDAHEQGFHVTLPTDAMTDSNPARHEHSVREIFPGIAETGSTQDVLGLL